MNRYVVRFRGIKPPGEEIEALQKRVKVLDSSAKQLLVEATATTIDQITAEFPQWQISRELMYKVPEEPIGIGKRLKK